MKLCFALLAVVAMATTANAAKLVILGSNSGTDTTSPYVNTQPPNLPPGAKGFLIGIDLEDAIVGGALGVQNVQFNNVVHQQGILDENGDPYLPPLPGDPDPRNIPTRSTGQLQQVYDAVAANGYLRSDTYVMDNAQQGSFVWTPVGPGFEGGSAGDTYFRVTGSLGLPSQINGPGPVQFVYLVSTGTQDPHLPGLTPGDVPIGGLLARGATGFDALGMPPGTAGQIYLDYETGTLQRIPEPSTIVLAGLGAVALAVGAWRRRK